MVAIKVTTILIIQMFKFTTTTTTPSLLTQGQRNLLLVINQSTFLLTRLEIIFPVMILSGLTVQTDFPELTYLKDLKHLKIQMRIYPEKITSTTRNTATLRLFQEFAGSPLPSLRASLWNWRHACQLPRTCSHTMR